MVHSASSAQPKLTKECVTLSTAETETFAEGIGQVAKPGWIIGLYGDLGAGKTAWVRGFAKGLGFTGRVHSPTYSLVNFYKGGRIPMAHLDLYRLNGKEELYAAGLDEFLVRPEGISVVEWVERWWGDPLETTLCTADLAEKPQALGVNQRWLRIECLDNSQRRIIYANLGV